MGNKQFTSLKEFYPFYLAEHKDTTSRVLHFTGTTCFFVFLIISLLTDKYWMLILLPVSGYGFAWAGHYFFEKNKPATFKYPLYSLASDFILYFQILAGRESFRSKRQEEKT